MALFDPTNGEFSDAAYGLDTHAAIAGEPSLFDTAAGPLINTAKVVGIGVPLVGLSIVNSFANTAIASVNFLTGSDIPKWSVEDEANTFSEIPGTGMAKDYYDAHQQGIEAGGFLIGSFIPGGAAIKALKVAQAGRLGNVMARATNIFAGPQKAILDTAMEQINAGDAALFPSIQAAKYKAIALGAGDQALQGLVFETAVAGTMNQSPMMEGQDLKDITTNMFYGALLGGGVGGLIEGIFTRAVINKAMLSADIGTKSSEIATRYGFTESATYKGTSIAGDRIVILMNSLDSISDDTVSVLASKKAAFTKDLGELNARNILSEMAGKGNEDIASVIMDTLLDMRASGLNKEDIYNKFAGLANISRIDSPSVIPTGESFYINLFAGKTTMTPLFENLITNAPLAEADLSLRYSLRDMASTPVVAKATDTFIDINGNEVAKYLNAQEAFDQGADIYIDPKFNIRVNPNAPNIEGRIPREGENRVLTAAEETVFRKTGKLPEGSAPLTGAPIILNTITKDVTSSAIPVVGDFGSPVIFDKGLMFGNKSSIQNINTPLTRTTSAIDSNARYVWAAKRGIRAGDNIASDDIPMLEQLYKEAINAKEGFTDYMNNLRQRGNVTISDGSDLPYTPNDLLNHIRQSKDDLIHDLISTNPAMSSEEVALRANVPQKYIETGGKAINPSDYIISTDQYLKPNHVKLEYDIGNTMTKDGNILRGLLQSQERIKTIVDASEAATAREFGQNYLEFIAKNVSSADATIQGARAGFLSFSNSAYGSLGQKMERIGRSVTLEIQRRLGEYSEILGPHANVLRDDPAASAELGAFMAVRRRTGEKYVFLPPEIAQKEWRTADTVVLQKSLIRDRNGNITGWNKDYTPDGFLPGAALVDNAVRIPDAGLHTFYDLSPKVAAFERAQMGINNNRIISKNNWYAAQGIARSADLDILHAPAIDTAKYPHFALVKAREGTAFSSDDTAVITAENAEKLEQKIAALRNDYSVYTKDMIADYHKALGDYQYNRNFYDSRVNSDIARRGILNDIFPDTRADTILQQYIDFNTRQEVRTVRDFVELGNNQLFAELRAMGERFTGAATSKTGYFNKFFERTVEDPYASYVKTALGIGPRDEYKLWNDAQEKLESFASTAFRKAKESFQSAKAGIIPFEEASAIMEKYGLGNPFAAATKPMEAYYDIANKLPPTAIISKVTGTANAIQSATAIRLDVWQSAINIISSPILTMAEASSILRDPNIAGMVLPDGSNRVIPAVTKLMYNAVKNWWNPEIQKVWTPIYKSANIVRELNSEYFEMVNNLALPYGKGWNESTVLSNLKSAVDTASKYTGSQFTENFVRWMAADVARQIFTKSGVTGTDLTDNISTFVNRVHGNYIASQRPVAFQGPVGQAMGLFQTYQINFMQQVFRYVENGEAKTLGLMAGLQTGLFGLQSLPGFQMINQHIVGEAAGNGGHSDLYNTSTNFFGKDLGDYLLYGVASNVLHTGLYSRGDINPRQITILPTNPLDFPAISGGINFIGNLISTADKIMQGGNLSDALLLGLEHNGISRPLSGLGQMMQGYVSTAKGSLVAATRPNMGDNSSGLSDLISVANASRLLGARPLDEAIAMDMLYRKSLYDAKDATRIERLGAAVKSGLVDNTAPLDAVKLATFMKGYTDAGGQIQNFGKEMMRWTQEANVSKANMIFRELSKPQAQHMMEQMGGVPLPDFVNHGNLAPPVTGLPTGNTTNSGFSGNP